MPRNILDILEAAGDGFSWGIKVGDTGSGAALVTVAPGYEKCYEERGFIVADSLESVIERATAAEEDEE